MEDALRVVDVERYLALKDKLLESGLNPLTIRLPLLNLDVEKFRKISRQTS